MATPVDPPKPAASDAAAETALTVVVDTLRTESLFSST